jgi:hypothetical protein
MPGEYAKASLAAHPAEEPRYKPLFEAVAAVAPT